MGRGSGWRRGGAVCLLSLALQALVLPVGSTAWAGPLPRVAVVPLAPLDGVSPAAASAFSTLLSDELRGREAIRWVPLERSDEASERDHGAAAIQAGLKAVKAGQLAKAAKQLEDGIARELSAADGIDFDRLAEARLQLAALRFRQGDEEAARAQLAAALRWAPALSAKGRFPPVFVREVERARARIDQGQKGRVSVHAPKGAEVKVDGRVVGSGALAVRDLPFGEHVVEVSLEGGERIARRVEVSAREAKVVARSERKAEAAPVLSSRIDLAEFEALSALLTRIDADAAVVGVVAPGADGELVARTALFSRAARGFALLEPLSFDRPLKLANVAAFRLADLAVAKVAAFGSAESLPLDLGRGDAASVAPPAEPVAAEPAPAPASEEVVEQAAPSVEARPELAAAAAPDRAKSTRAQRKAERLSQTWGDPSMEQKRTPWWVWALGGVGVAALAGGAYYGISQATRPVSGTVTATW